jgi:NADH dehydrogenase FAD-containing subunit
VYAIGDCCNTPEEKMAAYCTAHAETVAWNIWRSMKNQDKIAYKQRKRAVGLV